MLTRATILAPATIALFCLLGCLDRPLRAIVPCTQSGVVQEVDITSVDQIDLLFLVDNSASMREEQSALISEIPRLVTILATGQLPDGATFEPVASLRVGVITSDMGVGGVDTDVELLCGTPEGDDGLLLTMHRGGDATCDDAYPRFLDFASTTDDPTAFADSVGCLADTGSDGCAFEQQLEAVLKALTPSTSDITFRRTRGGVEVSNTPGHGDTENAVDRGDGTREGFVRPNSLLAIVVVTDEDDCSSEDIDLYDVSEDSVYPVPTFIDGQGIRRQARKRQCSAHRQAQHPIARYVDGLLALRPEAEGRLIFALLGGIAPEVVDTNSEQVVHNGVPVLEHDYAGMLADPSMEERPTSFGDDLVPGCTRPNPEAPSNEFLRNDAYPPRRLVQVAAGLQERGAAGVVASICQAVDAAQGDYRADFGPAIDAIVAAIASKIPSSCLPRPLIRNGLGNVTCNILETLPSGASCADHATRGRNPEAHSITPDGREVCSVRQIAPSREERSAGADPAGVGWFYDDYSARVNEDCTEDRRQQVRFTSGAEPVTGATFRLECVTPVSPPESTVDIGTSCEGNAQRCELSGVALDRLRSQYDRPRAALVCDDYSNTCRLVCTADADCPGGYVCFDAAQGNLGSAAYCLSPTCEF
ncbi:MAG: hypothetical protein H6726_02585 [Sandaracinaceae bacterium]|nr:hypothetical protein [Myxococcales bacterium]MCB9656510.1 hypothetical protein [Sandaracinaceae bacterium]